MVCFFMKKLFSRLGQSSVEYLLIIGGALAVCVVILAFVLNLTGASKENVETGISAIDKLQNKIKFGCEAPLDGAPSSLVGLNPGCNPDCQLAVTLDPLSHPSAALFFDAVNAKGVDGKLNLKSTGSWGESYVHCFLVNGQQVASIVSNPVPAGSSSGAVQLDLRSVALSAKRNTLGFDTGNGSCAPGNIDVDEASVTVESITYRYCPS